MSNVVQQAWLECAAAMGICLFLCFALCVAMHFSTRELERFYHDIVRSSHDKAG